MRYMFYSCVVLLLAVAARAWFAGNSLHDSLARADSALASVDSARAHVAAARRQVQGHVDSVEQANDSLRALLSTRATDTDRRVAHAQSRPTPADCADQMAERDSLLADTRRQRDDALQLFDRERVLTDSLRLVIAADSAQAVKDSLARAVARQAIRDVSRGSFLARLKPAPTVGPFLGICTDGKACAGVGVHLSWRL